MTRLLVINPGSTSTKFGVFDDDQPVFHQTIRHDEQLTQLPELSDQKAIREQMICEALDKANIALSTMDAIVGRGGLLHPLKGGVYEVNEAMLDDLESCRYGRHASNLGGIIAFDIATSVHVKAYIADPVIVDEMEPLARFSGWPAIERKSVFHALNQKAVARRYAKEHHHRYEDLNLIVAHLGGGISVGAHQRGRVIDVNNALSGDGPFSAERTGGLPFSDVIELAFSGHYEKEALEKDFIGKGGLVAYLGTGDAIAIDRRIDEGDEEAKMVMEAMAYQIAKEIGAAAAVLKGEVDAVILTGGLAYDPYLIEWIEKRVAFISPVTIYPGEDELSALADTVGKALHGELPIQIYDKEDGDDAPR